LCLWSERGQFGPPGAKHGLRQAYLSPGAHKENCAGAISPGAEPRALGGLRARRRSRFRRRDRCPRICGARRRIGLPAVALVDRNGVYGAPRFYKAAKAAGLAPWSARN
jgi:hypothetical protein